MLEQVPENKNLDVSHEGESISPRMGEYALFIPVEVDPTNKSRGEFFAERQKHITAFRESIEAYVVKEGLAGEVLGLTENPTCYAIFLECTARAARLIKDNVEGAGNLKDTTDPFEVD